MKELFTNLILLEPTLCFFFFQRFILIMTKIWLCFLFYFAFSTSVQELKGKFFYLIQKNHEIWKKSFLKFLKIARCEKIRDPKNKDKNGLKEKLKSIVKLIQQVENDADPQLAQERIFLIFKTILVIQHIFYRFPFE